MKNITLFISFFFVFGLLNSQSNSIPSVDLHTLDGSTFNTDSIQNDGKPIVISFWATWCKPCKNELNTIADVYEDWVEETGVKLIAVSIDDSRNVSKVSPYLATADWEYEVYLDENGDFKRAMNVYAPPHTFLLDKDRNIVWQHVGFSPGNEDELYAEILKLVGK